LGDYVDLSGKDLDLAPTFVLTGAFNHAIELGDGSKLRLRLASKYSDGYYLSDFQDAVRYHQPSFTRSDASVTYEFGKGRYGVQAFVENIEDKVQRTSLVGASYAGGAYGGVNGAVGPLPNNYLAFYTSTPRFYGARVSAKF
jgi:iron complex outermembrane receptor protein